MIQVFDKKLQQELDNDEEILKFEKLYEQTKHNSTLNTLEDKWNRDGYLSHYDGEVQRSRDEVKTSQILDDKITNKANVTSLLDRVNTRTQSSHDEVGDRGDMKSHSSRHNDREALALRLDKMNMKSHLSRDRLRMSTGSKTGHSDSRSDMIPLPSYLIDRVDMYRQLLKQKSHIKKKHKNLRVYRKLYRKLERKYNVSRFNSNYNDSNIDMVLNTNATILSRHKRKVDFDINNINNADWKLNYTTGKKKNPFDDDSYQVRHLSGH